MANLTSTTVTGTLDTTSTITGPGAGVSAINASNVSSGTLASDRLPTVPVSKGGTGLTALGSADQVLKVNAGGTGLEFGAAGGGGNYIQQVYTGSTTWTKPANVAAIKVTVVGGGGGAGGARGAPMTQVSKSGGGGGTAIEYIPAASIPGPVSVTVGPGGNPNGPPGYNSTGYGNPGGTSSFGAFCSGSGGTGGYGNPGPNQSGPGGSGSGGQININGSTGQPDQGGSSFYGPGGVKESMSAVNGTPGAGFGGGGSSATATDAQRGPYSGGSGASGAVIVEEFY